MSQPVALPLRQAGVSAQLPGGQVTRRPLRSPPVPSCGSLPCLPSASWPLALFWATRPSPQLLSLSFQSIYFHSLTQRAQAWAVQDRDLQIIRSPPVPAPCPLALSRLLPCPWASRALWGHLLALHSLPSLLGATSHSPAGIHWDSEQRHFGAF